MFAVGHGAPPLKRLFYPIVRARRRRVNATSSDPAWKSPLAAPPRFAILPPPTRPGRARRGRSS
ncbi:hypothetical protein N4286_14185, partial [Staphylococcus aureus]|nr:hypothetical protein [Staphylococcus aureus]